MGEIKEILDLYKWKALRPSSCSFSTSTLGDQHTYIGVAVGRGGTSKVFGETKISLDS